MIKFFENIVTYADESKKYCEKNVILAVIKR